MRQNLSLVDLTRAFPLKTRSSSLFARDPSALLLFIIRHLISSQSCTLSLGSLAMPEFEGIHACLVVKEHVLEEYDDPDYPFDPIYSHTRYVEAEEDQAFRVQITLRRGFDFCGADVVRCQLFLDDDRAPFWVSFTNSSSDGIVREELSHSISTATRRNEATGGWEKMPFVFGGLTVGESALIYGVVFRARSLTGIVFHGYTAHPLLRPYEDD
jgi:hypothetical protein